MENSLQTNTEKKRKHDEELHKLQLIVSRDKMVLKENLGLGNCFYLSLVELTKDTAEESRSKIATAEIESAQRDRYEFEFNQLKATDVLHTLYPRTYEEYASKTKLSGTYAGQVEVQVAMDVYSCNFRIYSSTGSYSLDSINPGYQNFPTYCLAQMENPPHWMAVMTDRLSDRVDQGAPILEPGTKRHCKSTCATKS